MSRVAVNRSPKLLAGDALVPRMIYQYCDAAHRGPQFQSHSHGLFMYLPNKPCWTMSV